MKRRTLFMLALAMLLCLTGCKDNPVSETEASTPIVTAAVETTAGAVQTETPTQYGETTTEEETLYKQRLSYLSDLRAAKVGSFVKLGKYEQDNDLTNGAEDIEWLVLEKNDEKMLVISRYGLDCQRYNTKDEYVTWETCTLRGWLNNNFYETAFISEEKNVIMASTIAADATPMYDTPAGNDTTDNVFLLSFVEAKRYFSDDAARECQGTPYSEAKGVSLLEEHCFWWLRSPGNDASQAVCVTVTGSVYGINGSAAGVCSGGTAVRPALWIDISSIPD
jgi:hypothetical protein